MLLTVSTTTHRPATGPGFPVGLVTVFKTEREGQRPRLAAQALPLEAFLPLVPPRGGVGLVRPLPEPVGAAVETSVVPLEVS